MSALLGLLGVFSFTISSVPTTTDSFCSESLFDQLIDETLSVRHYFGDVHYVQSPEIVPNNNIPPSFEPGRDGYEPNDDIEESYEITGPYVYNRGQYRLSLDAYLDTLYGNPDQDYYTINLLSDSHVSILSSAGCGDYSLSFSSLFYSGTSGGYANQLLETLFFDESNSSDKYCSLYLSAGVYFVNLEMNQSHLHQINYHLDVSVSKIERDESLDIWDARFAKNADAALWVSDLSFEGFPNNFLDYGTISTTRPGEIRDPLFASLQSLVSGAPIISSQLYIWDRSILEDISSRLDEVLAWIGGLIDDYGEELLRFDQSIQSFKVISKTTSIILRVIPISNIVGTVFSDVCDFVSYFLSYVYGSMREWYIDLSTYLDYLQNLSYSFSGILGTSEDEFVNPIVFPCSYVIDGTERNGFGYDLKYGGDTGTVYRPHVVTDRIIQTYLGSVGYASGSFYYLFEDSEGIVMRSPSHSSDDYCVSPLSVVHDTGFQRLLAGNYGLFSFTAPHDGVFSFTLARNGGWESIDPSCLGVLEMFSTIRNESIYNWIPEKMSTYTFNGCPYLDISLSSGETVYLRVRGNDWGALDACCIRVDEGAQSPLQHINHDFSIVQQYNFRKHRLICECGAYILENHIFGNIYYDDFGGKKSCNTCEYVTRII